ncbi:UDP-3-O-(3-hydroxymyristoyl)glucosamine N-acyltransferase [Verrucomicrobium sp. BvORR106]|uniref:UDP-3-O-(3-hydroxymyristoyl)glucosamine N-acyltransferase n=1 Tax=Verrucomicrobium sp. BvORR106 TaxID=1403819 RepID=UPI0005708173|nr:UDP-3-O-(3-hydroxymyristoyl)glucosamine N-acyltransferase [Verrucomicrobium sp. BvORR106]
MMNITLLELAEQLGVTPPADAENVSITGFASLGDARVGDLTFFSDARYRQHLSTTQASVVLVTADCEQVPSHLKTLVVPNPPAAFEKVVHKYGFQPTPPVTGIHPTAVVADPDFGGSTGISIGAHAVVEAGVRLGNNVVIGAGCYVGHNVQIGDDSRLFPNVTVQESCQIGRRVSIHSNTVIGADGFGYEFVNGEHRKVRQTGTVQIDDDVEIGACSTIDRARFGRTWIGQGSKIDNQVQVAHNVVIGKHCVIVASVGICGSVQIGDYVVIGGQVGIIEHVKIGSGASIAARTVVTKDLPPGRAAYMGFPAAPAKEERRRMAAARKLPELVETVRELQKKVEDLHPASQEH